MALTGANEICPDGHGHAGWPHEGGGAAENPGAEKTWIGSQVTHTGSCPSTSRGG
jgi:hypothetical protein